MNKTALYGGLILGIAVIMVFSSVAPVLQQAFAHDVPIPPGKPKLTTCPDDFKKADTKPGTHPDHNGNGTVCVKTVCHDGPAGKPPLCREVATVDDSIPFKTRRA